jgi:hypothetical protein
MSVAFYSLEEQQCRASLAELLPGGVAARKPVLVYQKASQAAAAE